MKMLKSMLLPGGALLLGVMALVYSGWLTLALPALSFLNYCALAGGMLLAWRFHSSRTFLALLVLFLAGQAVPLLGGGTPSVVLTIVRIVSVLVPINFVLIAVMHERGFTMESISPVALLLFVESVVVFVFSRISVTAPSAAHARHAAATMQFQGYALIILAAACVFLAGRFLFTRKPADSALLWSLLAFFLSLRFTENARTSLVYAAAAACILGASIIENSYLLAYHDELTTLPSRRAYKEALLRLQDPYSIAVVDIDHFKKFNDTYGHDTGDQVLRLVASNLARVTGGGEAYRCGGEEFNILFPGKKTAEVVEHLERLREDIQASEFRMRGNDRRQAPRGPDRRNEKSKGRATKGQIIRQLAQDKTSTLLSVTVSIGLATSSKKQADPDAVLKAADKALYRAKANGRNRLETASPQRTRTQAAGIAG
jgi:diguanylate cyclase (GGDEF)-like protein